MGLTSTYVQESYSETLHFPKLNGTNYYVWSDNMKVALQAHLLWLFVEGLEDCSPIPPTTHPLDSEGKPFVTTSVMNIEWNYSYYQPWSDNEWLVNEMIAMREEALMAQNEDITMQ